MEDSWIYQRGSTKGGGEIHTRRTFVIFPFHQMKENEWKARAHKKYLYKCQRQETRRERLFGDFKDRGKYEN